MARRSTVCRSAASVRTGRRSSCSPITCVPPMRLSALMKQPVLYVLTHVRSASAKTASTHQPVEHLAGAAGHFGPRRHATGGRQRSSRSVSRGALSLNDAPTAMVLTRQNLPTFDREKVRTAAGAAKGGYVLTRGDEKPQVILIATAVSCRSSSPPTCNSPPRGSRPGS